MRLLWINEHAAPVGGAERYVRETAAELARAGVENVLLYAVHGELSEAYVAGFAQAFPAVDIAAQVEQIQPDAIFLHRPVSDSTVEELLRLSVPTAAFHHDYDLFCPRRSKYRTIGSEPCERAVGWGCWPCLGVLQPAPPPVRVRLSLPGTLLAAQTVWKRLALHVVGSQHMARELARHGFDESRIAAVPLYSGDAPPADAAPERRRDRLLFAGQLVRGKGLDLALQALVELPSEVRLEVAGSGHQESKFRELAQRLGVAHRVDFLGRLGQAELTAAYRRAYCALMPSRYPETFGLVGTEAMAHGTPVVAAAVGAIPEWLEHGVTGLLVPPNNPAALGAAIKQLLADPALAARLGEAGLRRHAERYRVTHHVERLLPLLQKAAGLG